VTDTTETSAPWIISVDDHVVEPAHLFERWLPSKYQDEAPRVVRRHVRPITYRERGTMSEFTDDPDAPVADVWVFRNAEHMHRASIVLRIDDAIDDASRENIGVTYDEMRPGCYDPKARLADMDLNHTQGSLAFPSMPRFCGQMFHEQTADDRGLGLALVRAYNDWMVEEWCGDSGGRLIPLCVSPLWDADAAAAEIRRNADRGVRAVTFSEIPYFLGLPSIHSGYWDPFFAACADTGTVVCLHIGSSSKMMKTSPDAPALVDVALTAQHAMVSLVDFVYSGVLERLPNLKLAFSEGQIGWIPYMLERMDAVYRDHTWAREGVVMKTLPSELFRRQIIGCFFDDRHGVESAHEIGIDNLTFETDYPHADGTFPNSGTRAAEMLKVLSPDDARKVLRGNAIRFFELDLPETP
jgi:predicted TIM-barrel fold metal-dependent hydrolase